MNIGPVADDQRHGAAATPRAVAGQLRRVAPVVGLSAVATAYVLLFKIGIVVGLAFLAIDFAARVVAALVRKFLDHRLAVRTEEHRHKQAMKALQVADDMHKRDAAVAENGKTLPTTALTVDLMDARGQSLSRHVPAQRESQAASGAEEAPV